MNYIFVHLLDNKVFKSSLMHGTNIKIILILLNLFHILKVLLTLQLPLKPELSKILLPYEILGPIIRLHFSMHIHTNGTEGGKASITSDILNTRFPPKASFCL